MTQTLQEAIYDRLAQHDERESERREAQAALKASMRTDAVNGFHEYLRDKLDLCLPDEVLVTAIQTSPRRFAIAVHFNGAPGAPFVAHDWEWEFRGDQLEPIFDGNWRGHNLGGRAQSFGQFIDATIFALGGRQRLQAGRPLPVESEDMHVFN